MRIILVLSLNYFLIGSSFASNEGNLLDQKSNVQKKSDNSSVIKDWRKTPINSTLNDILPTAASLIFSGNHKILNDIIQEQYLKQKYLNKNSGMSEQIILANVFIELDIWNNIRAQVLSKIQNLFRAKKLWTSKWHKILDTVNNRVGNLTRFRIKNFITNQIDKQCEGEDVHQMIQDSIDVSITSFTSTKVVHQIKTKVSAKVRVMLEKQVRDQISSLIDDFLLPFDLEIEEGHDNFDNVLEASVDLVYLAYQLGTFEMRVTEEFAEIRDDVFHILKENNLNNTQCNPILRELKYTIIEEFEGNHSFVSNQLKFIESQLTRIEI